MARAGDVAGLALVELAHVDHLRGGILREPLRDPRGIDVDLGRLAWLLID